MTRMDAPGYPASLSGDELGRMTCADPRASLVPYTLVASVTCADPRASLHPGRFHSQEPGSPNISRVVHDKLWQHWLWRPRPHLPRHLRKPASGRT